MSGESLLSRNSNSRRHSEAADNSEAPEKRELEGLSAERIGQFGSFVVSGPYSGVSMPDAVLLEIQSLRLAEYQKNSTYLLSSEQMRIENSLDLDRRSLHFVVYLDCVLMAAVRLTPSPMEFPLLSDELKAVARDFQEFLEIGRLLARPSMRKVRLSERLLITAGEWVLQNTNYQGFVAICREARKSYFAKFGLISYQDRQFNLSSRAPEPYRLMWANFPMMIKAVYAGQDVKS